MHIVYIIESLSSGKWYYGYTSDPIKRLEAHNAGFNKSTRNRGPWKFIFQRTFIDKSEALKFEIHLKKLRRKEYILSKYSPYFL
ncbi:MAG: GIY-YIG nuclease family protein [Cyclobacteriaceae bacterium]|nr:GIY-YIG nuclease family protein [Cyclobacteriaceae bacterium]